MASKAHYDQLYCNGLNQYVRARDSKLTYRNAMILEVNVEKVDDTTIYLADQSH